MEYRSRLQVYALSEKKVKSINSLRLTALVSIVLRVVVSKKLLVIRFNDYFDNFLELSIQQIAILCPFSADRSSELRRRKKFSDIWSIAVPYERSVECGVEWSYIHV